MIVTNGLVLALPPTSGPALAVHLGDNHSSALAPHSCALELVADEPQHPHELHAIVSWRRAVPLKVERLVLAVMAAGGVLRRDLDPDGVRNRALAAGHHVARISSVADLEAFGDDGSAWRSRPTSPAVLHSAA